MNSRLLAVVFLLHLPSHVAAQKAAEDPVVYCEGQLFRCWTQEGSPPWRQGKRSFDSGFKIGTVPPKGGPDARVQISFLIDVPLPFLLKFASCIETGADPNWRLEDFEFILDTDNAGPNLMGRAKLAFARSRGPSVAAAALAECHAQFDAITEKLGKGTFRPTSIRLQHGEEHEGDSLSLSFDVVGERHRSAYATAVAMFEAAAQRTDKVIQRVQADPRETERADHAGATNAMSLVLSSELPGKREAAGKDDPQKKQPDEKK